MKKVMYKLIFGALLLVVLAACTAQAETPSTPEPTPTPAPTATPQELREKAAKPVVKEISSNLAAGSGNGQQVVFVSGLAGGASEMGRGVLLPISYDALTDEQLKIFDDIINPYIDKIKNGDIAVEKADEEQQASIRESVVARKLPINSNSLFAEHKDKTGYAEKIKKEQAPTPAPQENNNNNDWGGNNNAPQPSGGGGNDNTGGGGNDYTPPSGGGDNGGGNYIEDNGFTQGSDGGWHGNGTDADGESFEQDFYF